VLDKDPSRLLVVHSVGAVLLNSSGSCCCCLFLVIMRNADVDSREEIEEIVLLLFHMALQHSLAYRSRPDEEEVEGKR
jgi:hypothetical protein